MYVKQISCIKPGHRHILHIARPCLTIHHPESNHMHNDNKTLPALHHSRIVAFTVLHAFAVYACLYHVPRAHPYTLWFAVCLYVFGGFGVTIGLHRLWSHRSFQACTALRAVLLCASSVANQGSITHWVRDHRVHHRHSETTADPHDATRGLFFSHIGWLLVRKHPQVIEAGRAIDMSDVLSDPVVQFENRFYTPMVLLWCFVIPAVVPWWCWGERLCTAFLIAGALRLVLLLHVTWCVNSFAHAYGTRPYSRNRRGPAENPFVAVVSFGEGWHDWHHAFPHDYACSETNGVWNPSKWVIDGCAMMGWVWGRKRATEVWTIRKKRWKDTSTQQAREV